MTAAFAYRVLALGVLGVAVWAALYLYHRRKTLHLRAADAEHRTRHWRKVHQGGGRVGTVCPDCGADPIDWRAKSVHLQWHDELAEVLSGAQGKAPERPWTAIVDGQEPEVEALDG